MKSRAVVISALCAWGCGANAASDVAPGSGLGAEESALGNKDFDVDFSNCAEFVGIGFVPTANARPLVPAHYTLAGDANNAVIVVRVSRCAGSLLDGNVNGETTTSQVGISVTGQDTTADINNYTVFYATNEPVLHARLTAAGLGSDNTNDLSLEFSGAALDVASSSAHTPTFEVNGSAAAPTADPVQFIASWWADGNHGVFRQRTVFPAIRFSNSTVTLTTPAGSALAALVGGTSYTFALLDSYNTFPASHLEVRDTD
jgi:uncharacterized protein (DUF697 family)